MSMSMGGMSQTWGATTSASTLGGVAMHGNSCSGDDSGAGLGSPTTHHSGAGSPGGSARLKQTASSVLTAAESAGSPGASTLRSKSGRVRTWVPLETRFNTRHEAAAYLTMHSERKARQDQSLRDQKQNKLDRKERKELADDVHGSIKIFETKLRATQRDLKRADDDGDDDGIGDDDCAPATFAALTTAPARPLPPALNALLG